MMLDALTAARQLEAKGLETKVETQNAPSARVE
jgi:hypothetical protein